MINFNNWNGKALKGEWLFTLKIDGWQARNNTIFSSIVASNFVSKGLNRLNNLPNILIKDCEIAEIFCGTWNNTQSILSASKSKRRQVKRSEIYPLYPNIDPRLVIGTFTDPDARLIKLAFEQAVAEEYEGLVLRQGDNFIKVKPTYSEDVKITGWTEGKGKFKGMLGKFHTEHGDVGTGFTTAQREMYWKYIKYDKIHDGTMIEVEAMSKSSKGILRHPRFVRIRNDK